MSAKNSITTADAMSYEDYQKFLSGLHRDGRYNWEMFCMVAFSTGCRSSDVLNLRWLDVVGKEQLTVCEKKTGKVRRIPFSPSVQRSFKKVWEAAGMPNKTEYIMKSDTAPDKPYTIQHVNRKLKMMKFRYRINIGNFSTHTFRKTFGRYIYDTKGRTPESLMLLCQIFKHSNPRTTMVYLGITQKEINDVYSTIRF